MSNELLEALNILEQEKNIVKKLYLRQLRTLL